MKKFLLFLAVAGISSAASITLNTWQYWNTSEYEPIPSGVVAIGSPYNVPTTGGANGGGGLCNTTGSTGQYTLCPTTGPIGSNYYTLTFSLSSPTFLNILLEDEVTVGDVYELILTGPGGTQEWTSSIVQYQGTTAQACYNTGTVSASANNSCLNVTTGLEAAGSYSVVVWDIIDSYMGSSDPFGGGTLPTGEGTISPSTFALEINTVPEPATFGLLGLGGIAFGLLRRRIKS